MPQIVELPDKSEVEFPDGMSAEDINRELEKAFSPSKPSVLDRIVDSLAPLGEAMKKNELPQAGVPAVEVPTFGKPGTFTHGVSKGLSHLAESALTPEGVALAGAMTVPGVNVALGTTLSFAATKQAAQQAGEYSVTGDPEKLGEATVTGAAGLGGMAAVTAGKLAELRRSVAPKTTEALKEVIPDEIKTQEKGQEKGPEVTPAPAAEPFTPAALETPAGQTLGATGGVPLLPLAAMQRYARKWFTVRGHLPEEVHGLKQKLEAVKGATDFDIRMRERDLMGALSETYGLSKLELAGGGSRRIPPQDIQLMDAYLKGEVANAAQISPNIRGVLDTMRAEIDGYSKQVIDVLNEQMLQASPAKAKGLAELAEKIKNNLDVYVHRSYKFFDSDAPAPEWYAELNPGIRAKAEEFLTTNAKEPITREQAQSRLLDWLSDLREEASTGSSKLGAKDLSIFMRRKVIAPEIREVLGEYRSPMVNYAKSVAKMADWVAKQKFLEDVKAAGMNKFLFEEGKNPPGFNAQIAAEGSESMSPLNGLRTTQEIADAFREMHTVTDHGLIARTYLTLNAWTKFAATGLSWMTQARNLLSRPFMSAMAGHWQASKFGLSAKAIFQDFAGKDAAQRAYLNKLYKLGVMGDTARSGELRAIIKDAALQDVAPADLYSWSIARAIKKYGYEIPAEIYRLSDELGMIFGFENEKVLQAKINPTWSIEQVEAKAAKIIRNIYPVYSQSPPVVKAFRKVAVVGPFVTFPYQMFRTTWNALALSLSEIRSANSVERAVGYKRLASQMGVVNFTQAVQSMGRAHLGITTEDEDDFRRFQPQWAKNSKFLFIDKEPGELSAINLSYLDPYSYISDPVVAIAANARSDKDPFEIFAETTKEFFEPWVSEQMLAKAIIEARNGKTDSGREIVNPTDEPLEAFQKRVAHVTQTLKPGTVQRAERRIIPAIKNEQPIYGRKLETGPEIARELTGMAVEKFNFKDGLAFRAKEFNANDRAAESVFHQTVSRTETTTPEDLMAAYKESDERRFIVWQELRKDFLAAVRQGVPVLEAKKTMEARGMTKNDINRIINGRYEAMKVSDQAEKRAKERKRTLPLAEIRAYQIQAAQRNLDSPTAPTTP